MITTTTWHRLEPRVRGRDPAIGLRASVHDPLFLLGRQWQVGELLGEDSGSPIAVRIETAEFPLTRFRPSTGSARNFDPSAAPLEVIVEREPQTTVGADGAPRAAATLRQRLDAWTRLAALLAEAGRTDLLAALAAAHPLPPARGSDRSDARLRLLAGTGAGDGLAAAAALAADAGNVPDPVVKAFLDWAGRKPAAPGGDSWVTDRLEYRFAVGGSTPAGEVVLAASDYVGGRLDWHDLDVDTDPANSLTAPPSPGRKSVVHLLPTPVSFPGMPADRFWEFEDSVVDLGAVSAAAEDLGRLLTVEFATVFGNDWWQIPVRANFGSLVAVRSLVVRDTFGQNVLIEATEQAAAGMATAPWRMFRNSGAVLAAGAGASPPLLFLPPVLAGSLEADPIEELLLLRDEMANLGWAVERIVEGADGRPRNRSIEYGSRLTAAPPPALSSPAELVYVLQTVVPDHWIPLVPVRDPGGTAAVVLQRGALLTHDGTMRPITAEGILLAPDVSPWFFHEEEVPRAGLRIRRIPAIARWLDGKAFAWTSRQVNAGRGEGSSGLRFDIAIPPVP